MPFVAKTAVHDAFCFVRQWGRIVTSPLWLKTTFTLFKWPVRMTARVDRRTGAPSVLNTDVLSKSFVTVIEVIVFDLGLSL